MSSCGYSFRLDSPPPDEVFSSGWEREVEAQLLGRGVRARLFSAGRHEQVDLGDLGAFSFWPSSARICVERWPDEAAVDAEVWFGPALLFALAHHDIYALHASAFATGPGAAPTIAAVANSGMGKSTLAAAASRRGWNRIADDVLPTRILQDGRAELLPRFPQLKLPGDAQYPPSAPDRLTWTDLVQIERGASTQVQPLSASAVSRLVLTHTLASRLFPPQCLAAHLRWAAGIGAAVAGGQLRAWHLTLAERPDAPDLAAQHALDALEKQWIGL